MGLGESIRIIHLRLEFHPKFLPERDDGLISEWSAFGEIIPRPRQFPGVLITGEHQFAATDL